MSTKKLEKLKQIIEEFNTKYSDYHLVSYNMDKLDDNLKKALKNFFKAEQLDSGKAEDILFIDTKVYEKEIMELTGMDFTEFYLVVKNKEPIKTYPLVGESLDTILEYADYQDL